MLSIQSINLTLFLALSSYCCGQVRVPGPGGAAPAGGGGITYITGSAVTAAASGGGPVVAASVNASTANAGVACVASFSTDPSLSTVTSTSGTWTYVAGTSIQTAQASIALFQRIGSFSASEVIQATGTAPAIGVAFYSGLAGPDTTSGASNKGSNAGGSVTFQAGSATPGGNGELAFSCLSSYINITAVTPGVTGATLLSSVLGNASLLTLAIAHTIQTSATAFNPTWDLTASSGVGPTVGINSSFLP